MSAETWAELMPRSIRPRGELSVNVTPHLAKLSLAAYQALGSPENIRIRVSNAGRVIIIPDPSGPIKVGTVSNPRSISTTLTTWCRAAGYACKVYEATVNADGHLEFTAEKEQVNG